MRYLIILLLLTACSGTQMVKEPEQDAPDPGIYSQYLGNTYGELAVTYKVDAPALGSLGSEISMYKRNGIVKYEYDEFSYFPSTDRLCSGETCRSVRPDSDPDKKLLYLARVFSLNSELPAQAEYKGVKQAGERNCHRYFVSGMEFEGTCDSPVLDLCIDQETPYPLYITVLCNDKPAIIWTTLSVSNQVDESMFK